MEQVPGLARLPNFNGTSKYFYFVVRSCIEIFTHLEIFTHFDIRINIGVVKVYFSKLMNPMKLKQKNIIH